MYSISIRHTFKRIIYKFIITRDTLTTKKHSLFTLKVGDTNSQIEKRDLWEIYLWFMLLVGFGMNWFVLFSFGLNWSMQSVQDLSQDVLKYF